MDDFVCKHCGATAPTTDVRLAGGLSTRLCDECRTIWDVYCVASAEYADLVLADAEAVRVSRQGTDDEMRLATTRFVGAVRTMQALASDWLAKGH